MMDIRCGVRLLSLAVVTNIAGTAAFAAEPPFANPPKSASASVAGLKFVVSPSPVVLEGNYSRAQLVATALDAKGKTSERSPDLTRSAAYRSSNPAIVDVSKTGMLSAKADGKTTVVVTAGSTSIHVPVEVKGVQKEPTVSFSEQIEPILSKTGCNAAACHASQHGKGGFKLSVIGFAPDDDYAAITREYRGRRINLNDPKDSLILLKPTMGVNHGGARRLNADSPEYAVFHQWLKNGAPGPKPTDPKVAGIEVFPPSRAGTVGLVQQLRVVAEYSNGTKRDVTALAKFDSMDDGVVKVTPDGYATLVGKGQASVMVRFEGQANVSMMSSPFGDALALKGWKDNNFIDTLAAAKFRELGIEPSPLCDDAMFLRRAYLDAIGTLPKVEEATAFLDSKDPNKRAKLVDRLLGLTGDPAQDIYNDAYAAYWSIKWADLIRSSSENIGEQGMWALHNWLMESLRSNKPFDQFVRELVMAKGSAYSNGPANYYRVSANPADLAETTAQLFLGVRLMCAKCHHHPFEKYSQEDYYSFAAFFARVGVKNSSEFGLFGREQVVMVKTVGDVRHPRTGKIMAPTPLDGDPVADSLDPRLPLVEWLTAPNNEFFGRSIANRYFAYMMGTGLVEPIDDMRETNPPSNKELLDAVAKDFVDSKYNLKHMLKSIMNSRLYQLDSQPTKQNAVDRRFYSHYRVKRLGAEPLLDAIDYATGAQTKFLNMPKGTKAIELPDSNYPNVFLSTFGKPRRVSACECERVADENLAQALHTLNGDVLSEKIHDGKGRVAQLLAAKKTHEQIVTELYLATFSRRPTSAEWSVIENYRKQNADAKGFYEDLLWSLVNSKQFLFIR